MQHRPAMVAEGGCQEGVDVKLMFGELRLLRGNGVLTRRVLERRVAKK